MEFKRNNINLYLAKLNDGKLKFMEESLENGKPKGCLSLDALIQKIIQ